MEKPNTKNIGLAISGSFCTHSKILSVAKTLKQLGYNILPILTDIVATTDTRFGTHESFIKNLSEICENKPILTIVDAEPIGPKNLIDILLVAPCTGNTLAKLANAITDNAVTMTAKAHMRNNKPIVIGISSNDSLGLNMTNLAKLISAKNVFFVPFGQDDPLKKPKSLVCDFNKIPETLESAFKGEQLQPVIC